MGARRTYARHWIGIGPRPISVISKPSMTFISRMRCWNIRSQASEFAGGGTFRSPAPVSRARSDSPCGESSEAVILAITEFILTYDGKPSYTVSIMEFSGDKVARESTVLCRSLRGEPVARSVGRTHELKLRALGQFAGSCAATPGFTFPSGNGTASTIRQGQARQAGRQRRRGLVTLSARAAGDRRSFGLNRRDGRCGNPAAWGLVYL